MATPIAQETYMHMKQKKKAWARCWEVLWGIISQLYNARMCVRQRVRWLMYVVLCEQSGASSALAHVCTAKFKDQSGDKELKALTDRWLGGRTSFWFSFSVKVYLTTANNANDVWFQACPMSVCFWAFPVFRKAGTASHASVTESSFFCLVAFHHDWRHRDMDSPTGLQFSNLHPLLGITHSVLMPVLSHRFLTSWHGHAHQQCTPSRVGKKKPWQYR